MPVAAAEALAKGILDQLERLKAEPAIFNHQQQYSEPSMLQGSNLAKRAALPGATKFRAAKGKRPERLGDNSKSICKISFGAKTMRRDG